jgi:hypothetical protein
MKKRAASLVIVVSGIAWWLTLPSPPPSLTTSTPDPVATPQSPAAPLPDTKKVEALVEIDELPSLPDFSTLTEEEVHQTPEALIQAGEAIHKMIAAAEVEPQKRKATLSSLLDCAANKEYPKALRAQCYREGLSGIQRWDVTMSLSDYAIPVDIQTLSHKASN